jgi:hypothetical protein
MEAANYSRRGCFDQLLLDEVGTFFRVGSATMVVELTLNGSKNICT